MVQTMQELFPEGFSDLSGMDPSMLSGLFSTAKSDTGGQKNGLIQDTPLDAG